MPRTFVKPQIVRFKHCDSAGIVFYPRYFEMINDLVEDWFAEAIGLPFAQMHLAHGLGVPAVDVRCSFTAPSRLGERLRRLLTVSAAGRSSLTLSIRFTGDDGRLRLQAVLVVVFMNLETARAVAIPEDMRTALMPWLPDAAAVDSSISLE